MNTTEKSSTTDIIKFKSTNTTHEVFELAFDSNKTVLQYKEQIGELLNNESFDIKLISKGKVLNDKEKAGTLNLKHTTVMMVLAKNKKTQKPKLSSAQQAIPRTNLNTGLGSTSPVGFGGYGIMNHPQYMSAISSAVDEQKMQQIMNDPYYQGMMEQLLDDPDTLKQLLEENPMTKQLMDQNPMMKMMMSNPAMMKMLLNKETIKMANEMRKNPNNNSTDPLENLGNLGGLSNLLGGINNTQTNTNSQNQTQNPFGNPLFSMMGSGFGSLQNNQTFPNLFANPLLSSNLFPSQSQSNVSNSNPGSLSSLMATLTKVNDEQTYITQIKQLKCMGFQDADKCLKFLRQCDGDLDRALQKLCIDDDEKDKLLRKKNE